MTDDHQAIRPAVAIYSEAQFQLAQLQARDSALDEAAASHVDVVTRIRNDPKNYKHGKLLKSAKRASDFHERSAIAIRAMKTINNQSQKTGD